MIKVTALLFFFISASFIFQEAQAQDLTCRVDYHSGSVDRSRDLSQGEEGEASNNYFSEPDFELESFELTGYCDCTLKLYTKKNFGGCYIKSLEIYDGFVHREVSEIWTRRRNPPSFSFDCFF